MPDGHLQLRTLLNYLLQFAHLCIPIGHINRKQHPVLLHQMEHLHHFLTVQSYTPFLKQQALCRNLNPLESPCNKLTRLIQIARLTELTHSAYKETVGITGRNLSQIVILKTVNKLLCHHGRRHLCIVHVR